jgi:hypothetical protein
MSMTLMVRDETTAGESREAIELTFPTERITVRELIRSRVYQEVQDYNAEHAKASEDLKVFRGLVQPEGFEKALNGFKAPKSKKQVDWQKQFDKALEGFAGNGFLILVDDKQAEELDEEIELRRDTTVSFLKLVPLVGG